MAFSLNNLPSESSFFIESDDVAYLNSAINGDIGRANFELDYLSSNLGLCL